jgi:hypothetical protein
MEKMNWTPESGDDFTAIYKNYILRVEQMGPQKWWWAVYKDNKDLCYDNPFTRNLEYAKRIAEECVREDEKNSEVS